MAFLQKSFFRQTKFKPALLGQNTGRQKPQNSNTMGIKNQKGFMSIFLLPVTALMMTGFMGLASLSIGIKRITQTQSLCIRSNMKGQKELGFLLEKILHLNERVLNLHQTRQALEAKLALAVSTGQIQLIAPLKKALSFVKKGQNLLALKQKYLLNQSQLLKNKSFANFKKQIQKLSVSTVKEKSFFKKALALEKKKIGDKAYIYKPVPNFTDRQKTLFFWKMNPFYPLDINWMQFKHKNNFQYQCMASLMRERNVWISHLYH